MIDIKQKLKDLGLLKSKQDYDFFYRITRMLAVQKTQEFGHDFLKDLQTLTDIIENGREEDAKLYINSLEGNERKILAADTYYTMLNV